MQAKLKTKFFDPQIDGLTASSINTFLKCRPEFYLKYIEGLAPIVLNDSIVFGNIVHHVLEHAYKEHNFLSNDEIHVLVSNYIPYNPNLTPEQNKIDPETLADLAKIKLKAEVVLQWYFVQYVIDFSKEVDFVEASLSYNYKHCQTTENNCYVEQWLPLKGKLDLGFKDGWIVDHKCKSKWSLFNLETLLPVNIQANLYCWLYWKTFDKMPEGIKLNLIRNPSIQSKDYDELRSKLQKDIPEKLTHYFHRISYSPTKEYLDAWEQQHLNPIIKAILDFCNNPTNYYSDFQLENNFQLSPYTEALINNDFTKLRKRKYVHEELFI